MVTWIRKFSNLNPSVGYQVLGLGTRNSKNWKFYNSNVWLWKIFWNGMATKAARWCGHWSTLTLNTRKMHLSKLPLKNNRFFGLVVWTALFNGFNILKFLEDKLNSSKFSQASNKKLFKLQKSLKASYSCGSKSINCTIKIPVSKYL